MECLVSCSGRFTLGTYCIWGRTDPGAGLDTGWNRKIQSNPGRVICSQWFCSLLNWGSVCKMYCKKAVTAYVPQYLLPTGLRFRLYRHPYRSRLFACKSHAILENIGNSIAFSSLSCLKFCIHFLCYKTRIMNFKSK